MSSLDLQGFKQEGGAGKTSFYKNGKLALQGTLCGSMYLLDGNTVKAAALAAISKDDTALCGIADWHTQASKT